MMLGVTMIKKIMFLTFLILSIGVVSAETVEFEIWENSEGVFFATVDGGALQACNGTICVVEVDNLSTSLSLSEGDMKYIARYTSSQLELDGFKTSGQSGDEINSSILRSVLMDVIEEKQADDHAYISKTWMPEVAKYNNLSIELEEKRGAVKVLDAKFQVHAAELALKDSDIAMKNREIAIYQPIVIILFMWCGISLLGKSEFVRAIRERRER